MSSAESKSPRSPKTSSSSKARADAHYDAQVSSSSKDPLSVEPSSAEPSPSEPMDQLPDSSPIAPPTSPEVMSSTVPDPADTSVSLSKPSPATPPSRPPVEPAKLPEETLPEATLPEEALPQASLTEESAPLPQETVTQEIVVQEPQKSTVIRQQPIPPASEPMQYRAIGLVRGKYAPSEEQFTRGFLITDDGVAIDAVLLGRVMSLVKKHLDLEQSHLWVVYPRTREKEYDLHVQIVGVWEPENLNPAVAESGIGEEAADDELVEEAIAPEEASAPVVPADTEVKASASPEPPSEPASGTPVEEDIDDRYFSVRGEVVFYSPDTEQVLVKIRRIQRQADKQSKAFKVVLKGALEGGKSVGYFWDFNVQRQENILAIQDATLIKIVPPQKGEGGSRFSKGPRRGAPPAGRNKRWDGAAPRREGAVPRPRASGERSGSDRPERPLGERSGGDRPSRPVVPRERKEPATKPVLKRRNSESPES
ncbi:MAG TPA: hypothetical protein V6C84_00500 [Coleofasciculaceae cyanobacterium]